MPDETASNFIAGKVQGHVVQAGAIYGDVHFAAPPSRFPRFAGVPPRVTHLVGRVNELNVLREQLDSTTTVVVTGLGGVGKTSLLAELCHQHRPDFQLIRWIVASSYEEAVSALLSLASALGVDTTRLAADDAIRTAYEILGALDGRWLLVFDNVDQPGWINGLLPVEPNASVVITSRWRDWAGHGLGTVSLGAISTEDSVALLATITGYEPNDDAVRLATRLAGLSLAVRQAAIYCARTHCDFATYLRLLDERGDDMYQQDAPLAEVLETSLERVGALATAILRVCAFLPPTRIQADYFLAFASNEPLLRHGDEILVRDAIARLEQYSLLDRTRQEAGEPIRFGVHRLIQQLCRASVGEQWEQYSQTATRLLRRASSGWDYYVADSGAAVVGVERDTGRLLLAKTRDGSSSELPLPPDAVDLPLSVEVGDARVTARYTDTTAAWPIDERNTRPSAPTHILSDKLGLPDISVRLPDGRELDVCRGGREHSSAIGVTMDIILDGIELDRMLDTGGSRKVHAQTSPLIDSTGQWLVMAFYTDSAVEFGWIAGWRLEDVLAEDEPEVLYPDIYFAPNGSWRNDNPADPYACEPVRNLCFSADGSRLFLLDDWTIHAWSWSEDSSTEPDPELLWRISRPELQLDELSTDLGAPVRCCASLAHTDTVRVGLADDRVVDIRLRDLRITEVGSYRSPVAISPVDGSVLTADAGVVPAFGVDDRTFLGQTRDGRLVRVEPTGQLTDLADLPGDLLAVHRSGTAVIVRDDNDFHHLAVTGTGVRGANRVSLCRYHGAEHSFLTPVAFASTNLPVSYCDCHVVHKTGNEEQWWVLYGEWSSASRATALAADTGTAVVGSDDGRVTLWGRNRRVVVWGWREDVRRFTVAVSARPIHWLLPRLDANMIVAIDDIGHVVRLSWG